MLSLESLIGKPGSLTKLQLIWVYRANWGMTGDGDLQWNDSEGSIAYCRNKRLLMKISLAAMPKKRQRSPRIRIEQEFALYDSESDLIYLLDPDLDPQLEQGRPLVRKDTRPKQIKWVKFSF